MTASVPWSVNAVEPDTWATAREAARRSGLSVGEWLEAAIRETASERDAARPPAHRRPDSNRLEQRLDDISERLDHFMQHEPRARDKRGVQSLEETLEILGAGELTIDTGNGETLNASGVRHLRVEVQKNSPFSKLLERLSERMKKP